MRNLRRERLLTALTLLGLVTAFFAGVHLPGGRTDEALSAEIQHCKAEIDRGPVVLESYQAARAELDRRKAYLERTAASVAEPHDLLDTVSRLAKSSGLLVVRLEPEAVRARASYLERPYRVEFRGPLNATSDFLRGLEQNPRVHAIEELNIRKPANSDGAELEGTLRFVVFSGRTDQAAFAEENGSNASR